MSRERVQSVIFDRKMYSEDDARYWLAENRFWPVGKMHVTKKYMRFRQRIPRPGSRYFTREPHDGTGIKFVMEY